MWVRIITNLDDDGFFLSMSQLTAHISQKSIMGSPVPPYMYRALPSWRSERVSSSRHAILSQLKTDLGGDSQDPPLQSQGPMGRVSLDRQANDFE